MAEVLGLVASGVSIGALAGQIASSIVKLKSYLDQVKDAPEDVAILIHEIEDVHSLLSDIEDDQSRNPYSTKLLDNNSASRCLDYCKRGVERLERLVDEIAVDFEHLKPIKKTWKAAKIVWKRDRVEKYRADLASAVRLITLSHQIYTRSLIQLQPDIIASRITGLLQAESANRASVNSHLSSSTSKVKNSCSPSRMDGLKSAWLHWKSWSSLIGKAWEIEIYRSQLGWDVSMSVYAFVSPEAPVVKYTKDRNIHGLQRLFSRGEASPLTVCLDETCRYNIRSLLEIAASHGDLKICELLINEGAHPGFAADLEPIDSFIVYGAQYSALPSGPFQNDSCQLAGLLGAGSEVTLRRLGRYRGPASAFSVLLNQMDTPIGDMPIKDRCRLAIDLAAQAEVNSPDMFLTALGYNKIPHAGLANQYTGCYRETLLHAAAGAIGRLSCSGMRPDGKRDGNLCGWKSIIQDLVAAGANLHATCLQHYLKGFRVKCAKADGQITPLMFMLCDMLTWRLRYYRHESDLNRAVRTWTSALYDSGVDLKTYGLRERLAWFSFEEDTDFKIKYPWNSPRGKSDWMRDYYFGQKRIIGFNYGPLPEDWSVIENEPTDEFAGKFWLMLERREEVMPGSWID